MKIHCLVGRLIVLGLALCAQWAKGYDTVSISSSEYSSDPYKWTGMVFAYNRGGSTAQWRGSGTVARHPKIVISCAHNVHDSTNWFAGDFRWFRQWSSNSSPSASQGQLMRGHIRWGSYQTEKLNDARRGVPQGQSSPDSFDHDITAFWSFENTAGGGYAAWWHDGRSSMRSNARKMITGYPARPFGAWTHLQYRTGPFTDVFQTVTKMGGGSTTRYMRPYGNTVNLGGNSGGPLWVHSSSTGWSQAGVFVSSGTGVTALDTAAWDIVVQAINSTGSPTTPPPTPTPSDDHGGSSGTATVLAVGTSISGVINAAGDLDYFRLNASSAGDYVIESSGETDLFGSLLSSAQSVISEDDDSGPSTNFRIAVRLAAGTYYIRVRGYSSSATGAYSLRVMQTSVLAPEIEVLGTGSRVIVAGDSSPESGDGTHFGTVASGASVVRVFTVRNRGNQSLNLTGSISLQGASAAPFSVSAQPSATIAAGASSTFSIRFAPSSGGNYFATVTIPNNDGDESPYTFEVTGTSSAPTVDDTGNNIGSSTAISVPSVTARSLEVGGDQDFFRFTVPQQALYTIETKGSTDTLGLLYNSGGALVVQDDDAGEDANFRIIRVLAPGTYHVNVRGYGAATTGAYQLRISVSQATPDIRVLGLESSVIVDGSETARTDDGTDFGSVLHGSGFVERIFRIENVGFADLLLSGSPLIQVSGAGAQHFSVLTIPAATVAAGAHTTFRVRYSPASPGAHVAMISIVSNDLDENPYEFMIGGTGAGTADEYGNTFALAHSMAFPGVQTGALQRGGDVDVFRFVVTESRTVTIESTGSTDTSGYLYDSTEKLLIRDDQSGSGSNFRISQVLYPGVYYVRLTGATSSTTGGYTLTITAGSLLSSQISILGRSSRPIPEGSTQPLVADGTDFGDVAVGGAFVDRAFTIKNTGSGRLDLTGNPPVRVTGPGSSAFSVAAQPVAALASNATTIFKIRFDPLAAGASNATVEIRSNDATVPVLRFAIRGTGTGLSTLDDYGDTRLSATGVSVNTTLGGVIDYRNDRDWFSFILNVESLVVIQSTGSLDTFGHLYGEDGRQLASDDDAGSGLNFGIAKTLPAGRYTLQVRGYNAAISGAYGLSIQVQAAYPDIELSINSVIIPSGATNDSVSNVTDFGSVNYARGAKSLVYRVANKGSGTLVLGGSPRVSLTGAGADQFRVNVLPSPTVKSGGFSSVTLVYDPSGSGIHQAVVNIPSNDPDEPMYTFAVKGFGAGASTADDHGNTTATATLLPLGAVNFPGHLERAGDIDYFRIELAGTGVLHLSSLGSTDTFGALYDSAGREMVRNDDDGELLNFRLSSTVSAGTYYLRVSGYAGTKVGQYTLACNFAGGGDDHSDTFSGASSISLGGSVGGTLGVQDVDVFVITLSADAVVLFGTTGTTDTYGELYNSSGALMSSDDDSGVGTNFEIYRNLPAGRYYIRIRAYGSLTTGAYTLSVIQQ